MIWRWHAYGVCVAGVHSASKQYICFYIDFDIDIDICVLRVCACVCVCVCVFVCMVVRTYMERM